MADAMTTEHESFQQPTPWMFCLVKSIIKFIFHLWFSEEKSKENFRQSWKELGDDRVISPILTNKENYMKKGQRS